MSCYARTVMAEPFTIWCGDLGGTTVTVSGAAEGAQCAAIALRLPRELRVSDVYPGG